MLLILSNHIHYIPNGFIKQNLRSLSIERIDRNYIKLEGDDIIDIYVSEMI